MIEYKVKKEEFGQRLDKFLRSKLPDLSRSQIQKMIKKGLVVVAGKQVVPHYFLKEEDVVEIKKIEIKELIEKENSDLLEKIKIIKETDDFLVINKPVGLLVHPDNVHKENTLADWLIKRYPKIKNVWDKENKRGNLRPGIVHRLDRDVSGLLVVAKNQKMFDWLKKQFQERKVKKEYQALVYGEISQDEGLIARPIARSKKTGFMVAKTSYQEDAKSAFTEFKVIKRFKNYTLLKIILKTGRTHQIRVHLKSIGHSVVGDTLYQTRDVKLKKKKCELKSLFLCAVKLGFYDLKNDWVEFKIQLPKELKDFLRGLRLKN